MFERNKPIATRWQKALLATCPIPWNTEGQFEESIFRRLIRTLQIAGLRDLYIFGTAGEGYAVTDSQFRQIVTVFLDEVTGEDTAMIGIISQSLPTILERIETACELGARSFQLSLPNWGALTDLELETFFELTCGAFPNICFLHYNIARSGRTLNANHYVDLAAQYPNLVATKYGAGNLQIIQDLVTNASTLKHFFTEPGFVYGSLFGECGLIPTLSVAAPTHAKHLLSLGEQRDITNSTQILKRIAALRTEIRSHLDPSDGVHMDGAFDKLYAKALLPEFPLRLLPPYKGFPDMHFPSVRTAFDNFNTWSI